VEFDVRVIPRARKTEIGGVRDGVLVVRLAAPPVENAANDALVEFLARLVDVPRRSITLRSGAKSRLKRIAIAGITARRMTACLPIS
jgi:uncharacterized protein YggU (UPF0235/DUF167 family)